MSLVSACGGSGNGFPGKTGVNSGVYSAGLRKNPYRTSNTGTRVSVATYNVHGWIGTDNREDPERVLGVVRALEADVIALQEVPLPSKGMGRLTLEALSEATGMVAIPGPTLFRNDAHYGNVLLLKEPVENSCTVDISVLNREPRGAIIADLPLPGNSLRIIATHLGLHAWERRIQAARLIEEAGPREDKPFILMGDMNEWNLFSPTLRLLRSRFGRTPAPPSYPSRFPVLALDRIFVLPWEARVEVVVYRAPPARTASDHKPVQAFIEFP